MKYYVKPKKSKVKASITVGIIFFLIVFTIYFFDKKIFPAVLIKSESMVKAQTIDTISKTSMELFDEEFKYSEMILIDKDSDGSINLIRADTTKLNKLASEISIKCNEELQAMGNVGVKVPMGWVTDKSIFYNLGPDITVKIEPIGSINVTYESKFESAGINQTRHTIYLNVEANVRTVIPLHSQEINVSCEVPVSETIVVGKIPDTAIDFKNSGN